MKKGFTLIELLAVIVILAIIAMIATPIILNIIKSSKEEAVLRSAENYLDAVTQAVARENLNNEFNPSTCDVTSEGNLSCSGHEVKVEIDGEKPSGNFVEFNNGKIVDYELVFEGGTVTPDGIKGSKTNTSNDVASGYISSVENLISSGKIQTTSEEIECDVTNESNISYIKCGSQDKVQVDISGTLPVGVIILKDDKAIRYNLMFGEESVIVHEDTIDEWDGTSVSTGLNGCGTEASPFLIQSAADLIYMRNQINAAGPIAVLDSETCGAQYAGANSAYYKQTVNISLNSDSENYLSWGNAAPSNSWTPIGTNSNAPFVGQYNGGVHYINGLYSPDNYSAFIYQIASTMGLKNLEINNSYFTSSSFVYTTLGGSHIFKNCGSNSYLVNNNTIGGYIATIPVSSSITLNNLVFNGKINGTAESGGIIGTIATAGQLIATNIIVDVDITGAYTGGFGGSIYGGAVTLSNFVNKGGLITSTSTAGGLIGTFNLGSETIIDNIVNYSNIEGYLGVGGLIGYSTNAPLTINNSLNKGNIKAESDNVGGIVGYASSNLFLNNCYNTGMLTGEYYIGGLIGYGKTLNINSSYNLGDVNTTKGYSGGIVGEADKTLIVSEVFNNSNISGNGYYLGGFVGRLGGVAQISNSYNAGTITAETTDWSIRLGGIIGYESSSKSSTIKNVYNAATISTSLENVPDSDIFASGISVVINTSNTSTLENVYNVGNINITSDAANNQLFGIAQTIGTSTNVHNAGTIKYTGTGKSVIGGLFNTVTTFTNNSYLSSTAPVGVANYTTDDSGNIVYTESDGIIKVSSKGDMPSVLSVVNGDNKFKEDTNNINNGYPILSWQ